MKNAAVSKFTTTKVSFPQLLAIFFLITAVAAGLIVTVAPMLSGLFPLTFDQGRDFLWVKNQIDFLKPSLIGPWGSLEGTFFGPLWFWLLSIPYIIFGGSPLAMALFNTFVVYAAILTAALLVKRRSSVAAYFIAIFGFTSFGIRGPASFPFSQHLLPLLTISLILTKPALKPILLALLLISIMFHSEPVTALVSLPSFILIFALSPQSKKLITPRNITLAAITFCLPFLPQLFFDYRHQFLQFKAIGKFLSGYQGNFGGEILPLSQRLTLYLQEFFTIFRRAVLLEPPVISLILLLIIILTNLCHPSNSFLRKIWQASLIYITSFLIGFILLPWPLKLMYLTGLLPLYILWLGLGFKQLWQLRFLRLPLIALTLTLIWLNLDPIYFIDSYRNNFADKYQYGSLFVNQKSALDWIYQQTNQQGFKVYTYVPPVYDYNYQYLFFWYGMGKYGYLPQEFSYLPNQPEYVPLKSAQLNKLDSYIKPDSGHLFLIIEIDTTAGRVEEWLTKLPLQNYAIIDQVVLPDRTQIKHYRLLDS
jgi:hypothetical protein